MNQLDVFRDIKTFILDVDGVLTDCSVLILSDGKLLRTMNVRDGFAIKMALRSGYQVAVITAGRSSGVKARLQGLGVEHVMLGVEDKAEAFDDLAARIGINPDYTLYMGDDLPDRSVMLKVALPVCPADAVQEIKDIARYISPIKGGHGCVRDVVEKVLTLNGHWPPKLH